MKDLSEIEKHLSCWYEPDRYNYDFGYEEGEEDGFEQCKQAMLADGYDEEDIDDDSINDWVWEHMGADCDALVKATNAIIDKYNPYSFDYFEFDVSRDYWGEVYTFSVDIKLPNEFDSEEDKDSVFEEIGRLGELLDEVTDLEWNCYDDGYGYDDALRSLVDYVQSIPVYDYDDPANDWED